MRQVSIVSNVLTFALIKCIYTIITHSFVVIICHTSVSRINEAPSLHIHDEKAWEPTVPVPLAASMVNAGLENHTALSKKEQSKKHQNQLDGLSR